MKRLLIGGLLCAGGPAFAEPPDAARRISVVGLDPVTGEGLVTLESGARLDHLELRLGLGFDYAYRPLVVGRGDQPSYAAVEHLGVVDVSAAFGLGGVVDVGLHLPIVAMSRGGTGVGATATLEGAAVGDLRIVPKIGTDIGSFAMAFAPAFTLPSGDEATNAGERGPTFEPSVAASYRFADRSELVLQIGYRARSSLPLGNLLVDDELSFGLGGRWQIHDQVDLIAELFGAVGIQDSDAVPVETLGALEFKSGRFALQVGGGAGLTSAWGAPQARAFLALSHTFDFTRPPYVPPPPVVVPVDPDSDSDGLRDSVDRCVHAAEDLDQYLDGDGCPDLDDDSDGILDTADRCPRDAEVVNGLDDEDGCPDEAKVALTDKGLELKDAIYFVPGRADIMPVSEPLLDDIGAFLKANHQVKKVRIEGHTDNIGSRLVNQALSEARAKAVLDALVARGVEASRLESAGFGSSRPTCNQPTDECRANNRRTEFHLVDMPE